jgi:hypothetical protein
VDANTTWERVLEKLARPEEAQSDRPLARTLNQPANLIGGTTNGS